MAIGRKTGGRKKGSKNKSKAPLVKQLAAERSEARARAKALAQAEAKVEAAREQLEAAVAGESEQMPLDVMLMFMRDREMPPGFRGDMAKAAAVYLHSKAPEAQPEKVVHITEIRHVIVEPKNDVSKDTRDGAEIGGSGEWKN